MKSKFFFSNLLALILFLGVQSQSQAQLTIQNRTSCTIYIQASQVDNGARPCTPCNVSNYIPIIAGGTYVYPGDASCGHYRWLGVRWYMNASGTVGTSFSPLWQGRCGQNVGGGRCNGTSTYARWHLPSSVGPATVAILEL